jgi:hypothetical protein
MDHTVYYTMYIGIFIFIKSKLPWLVEYNSTWLLKSLSSSWVHYYYILCAVKLSDGQNRFGVVKFIAVWSFYYHTLPNGLYSSYIYYYRYRNSVPPIDVVILLLYIQVIGI